MELEKLEFISFAVSIWSRARGSEAWQTKPWRHQPSLGCQPHGRLPFVPPCLSQEHFQALVLSLVFIAIISVLAGGDICSRLATGAAGVCAAPCVQRVGSH